MTNGDDSNWPYTYTEENPRYAHDIPVGSGRPFMRKTVRDYYKVDCGPIIRRAIDATDHTLAIDALRQTIMRGQLGGYCDPEGKSGSFDG